MDLALEVGVQVEKIDFKRLDGSADFAGNLASQNAAEIAAALDQDAASITSAYVKTPGGGIRGSLMTTGYLIVVSLLIALPIGIAAAIYLNEYANKSRLNRMIRSGIETLTGVPSIVYGLMGVSVLFPITRAFGATTTNILLGSLTMQLFYCRPSFVPQRKLCSLCPTVCVMRACPWAPISHRRSSRSCCPVRCRVF